jgi:prophage tail gpP-like protein
MGKKIADDTTGGAPTDVKSTAQNPTAQTKRTITEIAPMPADKQDTQMHANHIRDLNMAQAVDCNITVRGWLNEQGKLWMNFVGQHISVFSPMLFPQKSAQLLINSVTHKQNDSVGTVTTLGLTIDKGSGLSGIGSMGPNANPPSVGEDAK